MPDFKKDDSFYRYSKYGYQFFHVIERAPSTRIHILKTAKEASYIRLFHARYEN